jgi:2',3'-cyclic-nucleotide 2'-phosphodiesterase
VSSVPPVSQNKPRGAIRVLFVGDVFGKPGLGAVRLLLPGLLRSQQVDFCIVNGENAEQGKGILPPQVHELFDAGADVITGGNHSLYRDRAHEIHESEPRLLRPYNLPEGSPGHGMGVFDATGGKRIAVVNLHGRAYLPPSDDPFRLGKALLEKLREETPVIIVDFHAEATAEKMSFARYIDGLATAVIGTHTHVQTADEQVLEGGTAYISDAGMTGSYAGVIGMKTEHALHRFLYPMSALKSAPAEGDARLVGVIVDADPATGRALQIQRVEARIPG